MTSHYYHLLFSLLFLLSVGGCFSKKPAGFPDVFPCTIHVLKDGVPLGQVSILLDAAEPAFHNIGYAGETDAQGNAVMHTSYPNYTTQGIPAGQYKVLLKKRDTIAGEKSREELNKMNNEELEVYTAQIERKRRTHIPTIPPHFWEFETTPLQITVEAAAADITLDLKDYPAGKK